MIEDVSDEEGSNENEIPRNKSSEQKRYNLKVDIFNNDLKA